MGITKVRALFHRQSMSYRVHPQHWQAYRQRSPEQITHLQVGTQQQMDPGPHTFTERQGSQRVHQLRSMHSGIQQLLIMQMVQLQELYLQAKLPSEARRLILQEILAHLQNQISTLLAGTHSQMEQVRPTPKIVHIFHQEM